MLPSKPRSSTTKNTSGKETADIVEPVDRLDAEARGRMSCTTFHDANALKSVSSAQSEKEVERREFGD